MSARQPSEQQQAASRTNGAKSTGPVSVAGRARSSRNSLRHGLRSETVVLPHEDRGAFDSLRDSYMESLQPADQPQHDLVETMAAARWRLNRLLGIESTIFEKEMLLSSNIKAMAKEFTEMSEVEKLAWVFDRMANQGKSLGTLLRYEARINRTYEQAFKQLQVLQKERPPAPEPELPNEPKPLLVLAPKPQRSETDDLASAPPEAQTPPPAPPSQPISAPEPAPKSPSPL
jgi:hypothetical protein